MAATHLQEEAVAVGLQELLQPQLFAQPGLERCQTQPRSPWRITSIGPSGVSLHQCHCRIHQARLQLSAGTQAGAKGRA